MFFAAPKVIETTVFARLPEELKNADSANDWVARQPLGTLAGSLLEGPSFDKEGNFWCVDIQNGRVFKVTRDGVFHVVAAYDGWPNGLKFHRDGRIFIADYKHGIMLLDPVNGKIMPYLERLRDETGVPMIYVSHHAAEVRRLATRVVRIESGRVAAVGGLELLDGAPTDLSA